MKSILWICCFISIFLISCTFQQTTKSSFQFNSSKAGVELLENGHPVFFYQKMPKSLDGRYVCTNYIHPLYSLNGDILTEEFPVDHPYHRGIFWAWHQMVADGKSLGDGWIMKNISQEVTNVEPTLLNDLAELKINSVWKSELFNSNKPYLVEKTTITVHPKENDVRKIDFQISLQALVPNIEIGGSDDEKGYGGFCARLKLPEDLTFTSKNKLVAPQELQVKAGPWMDFSASFGKNEKSSGVTILCHPDTPNYPAPWILRAKTSMQNVVFPGRNLISIPTNKPVNLYYRLIIHNEKADKINLDQLQDEYAKMKVQKR
jgi:hypothetical protein